MADKPTTIEKVSSLVVTFEQDTSVEGQLRLKVSDSERAHDYGATDSGEILLLAYVKDEDHGLKTLRAALPGVLSTARARHAARLIKAQENATE